MEHIRLRELCEIKNIFKRLLLCLSIPAISLIYPLLDKPTGREHILYSFIDSGIPFNKYFITAYIAWYVYVVLFLFCFCIINKKSYYNLLISLCAGMLICYIFFYLFPTHVPRPDVNESDLFSNLVRIIYQTDNPFNCFPSIHVINSLLIAIYVNRETKFNIGVKIASSIVCIFIILSTLFVKQHCFADVVSGILLAYILYFVLDGVILSRIENYILRRSNSGTN